MNTKAIDKPGKSDRSTASRQPAHVTAVSTRALSAAATTSRKSETPALRHSGERHVTKHAQLLRLLSRREGASMDDMMRVTDWQQHSVRGFLAGTVKKKMGFALTSTKVEGAERRYKVAMPKGR